MERRFMPPIAVHPLGQPSRRVSSSGNSVGVGYYVFAPEAGVVTKRLVPPGDKAAGIYDFIHLSDLNRPLRAGDTFGWRVRFHTPNVSLSKFQVLEVLEVPENARVFTQPAGLGSSWHEHLLEEQRPRTQAERNLKTYDSNTFFNLLSINTTDRGRVKAHLFANSFVAGPSENYKASNFWTLASDDPDGEYVANIWVDNKLIGRVHFPVRQSR